MSPAITSPTLRNWPQVLEEAAPPQVEMRNAPWGQLAAGAETIGAPKQHPPQIAELQDGGNLGVTRQVEVEQATEMRTARSCPSHAYMPVVIESHISLTSPNMSHVRRGSLSNQG
eukprot:315100-Chlamydomonas_euryale.AAC.3